MVAGAPPARNTVRACVIEVYGEWEKERFIVNQGASSSRLSSTGWHAVEIKVTPGSRAHVGVDGKALGQVSAERVARVGFDCGDHGFVPDHVELFYAKQRGRR